MKKKDFRTTSSTSGTQYPCLLKSEEESCRCEYAMHVETRLCTGAMGRNRYIQGDAIRDGRKNIPKIGDVGRRSRPDARPWTH